MAYAIEDFDWFCGVNSTETLHNFSWTLDDTLHNGCFTSLVYIVPHLIFIILASLILLICRLCTGLRYLKHNYLLQYPGHVVLWMLYLPLVFTLIFSIGEGILTDLDVKAGYPTQPQLYVPACFAALSGLLALMYFNMMEYWDVPHMSWLLLVYWAGALGAESVRFYHFYYEEEIDLDILRFDLNVAMMVLYSLFMLLGLHVIRTKVSTVSLK